MSRATYRQMMTVPAHVRFQLKHDMKADQIPADIKWSHLTFDVPAIGDVIHVRGNRIGPARVMSYFVEDGFLGLLVRPLAPPEWYVKQNGRFCDCHVYGAETDPLTDLPELRATARVIRHRDPSDIGHGTLRKGDRYTVNVYGPTGTLLLDGREKRRDPELAVKLAEKFCARNGLKLFAVEVP